MQIFEISQPGTWLDSNDRDLVDRVQPLLESMRLHFFEANAAVNLFLAPEPEPELNLQFLSDQRNASRDRRLQLRAEMEHELPAHAADIVAFELEVTKRLKRERWEQGATPLELRQARKRIYAQGFVHAVDTIRKLLDQLRRTPGAPPGLSVLRDELLVAFPDLKDVRDSTQHTEERVLGKFFSKATRKPEKIPLQAVENSAISAPSGVLAVANLRGNRYGTTTFDGRYGEVEVSLTSMQELQRVFTAVLNSFLWRGPAQHFPGDL